MMNWKKGRGKLGIFAPLIGAWICNEGSKEFERPECTRRITKALGGKYIQLEVSWNLGKKTYDEFCLIGLNRDQEINFWSFQNDGKNSQGHLADVTDLHPQAIGFKAQMPSGLARQAYYPHAEEGFIWVVEAQNKKGWRRIVEQHFTPLG